MKKLRIVFMGTGKLAQPVFEALVHSRHEIVGLVTQPDRTGRGHHRHENPLKTLAETRQIAVIQPEKIKQPEPVAQLRAMNADLFVVAAYGQILSREILGIPLLGTINVHASLLPKYRGATPIHAAVLNRDAESGISIMMLEPRLDAGPVLAMARTAIGPKETTGELEQRLAVLAVPAALEVIEQLAAGTPRPVAQEEAMASHVGKLSKADGAIPWSKPAVEVEAFCRGMQPWPGPYCCLFSNDATPLRLLIHDVDVDTSAAAAESTATGNTPAGSITSITSDSFTVQCGLGKVAMRRLQPEGKRSMSCGEFLRGRSVAVGDRLGPLEATND